MSMTVYSFEELLTYVRKNSPFYRSLYQHLGASPQLQELPLLDSSAFWAANGLKQNQVLTSVPEDGIVFKSGGTSGNPKFSYFSKEEWNTFTEAFGAGMTRGGLRDGERIANMFYAGDLYASFLFIMDSITASPKKLLQFPIGGAADSNSIMETLEKFNIDVWAGVPTTMLKLADLVAKNKIFSPKKILFGGESLYPDQRQHLLQLFPGVTIQSIGYASVDGGLLGYVDSSCQAQEHRVFSETTVIEIVDEESGEPIHDIGRPGKVILTNLTRRLMPILRYPVGDRAEWVENQGQAQDRPALDRRFRILGRSEEGARVGPATLYYEDMARLLGQLQSQLKSRGFQFVLRHFDHLDQLILRIAVDSTEDISPQTIIDAIESERPMLRELIAKKLIHPITIQLVSVNDLILQPRTGKLKRLIDERLVKSTT